MFWAGADLDAINEAVGATRKRGGWRAVAANSRKMPSVVTSVNGDQLDGRHVFATDGGEVPRLEDVEAPPEPAVAAATAGRGELTAIAERGIAHCHAIEDLARSSAGRDCRAVGQHAR